jgi:hypothetical protein
VDGDLLSLLIRQLVLDLRIQDTYLEKQVFLEEFPKSKFTCLEIGKP